MSLIMLLIACCIHVLVNLLQAFMSVACHGQSGVTFLDIQHNFSEYSVYMNSVRPLTILVLLAFCMRFITRVGGT